MAQKYKQKPFFNLICW